jgi:hypothetical protein
MKKTAFEVFLVIVGLIAGIILTYVFFPRVETSYNSNLIPQATCIGNAIALNTTQNNLNNCQTSKTCYRNNFQSCFVAISQAVATRDCTGVGDYSVCVSNFKTAITTCNNQFMSCGG